MLFGVAMKSRGVRAAITALACWGTVLGITMTVRAVASDEPAVTRYDVHISQIEDGLPHNSVRALAQTADGYLWIGTEGGLVRFDGVRFTPPAAAPMLFLQTARITALHAGGDGSLWIGTETEGLMRWKATEFQRWSVTNGLPSNQVNSLLEGHDGAMWIGTEAGLVSYKAGRTRVFAERDGLPDASVRSVYEDEAGVLRIATRSALYSMRPGGLISTENFGLGAIPGGMRAVHQDRSGTVWVGGTGGLRFARLGQTNAEAVELRQQIVTSLLEDRTGQLWVGTYAGVARLQGGHVRAWPLTEVAAGDLVYAMLEDREGNIWLGGRDGLYRLTPARFTTLTTQQGLSGNNVTSICEDAAGVLWFGVWGGGVNQFKDGVLRPIGSTNGLTHDAVLSLCASRDGGLWIGMDHSGGLNRLTGGEGQNVFPPKTEGLLNTAIRVIHEDRQGALWIGDSRGLNVLRNGRFETYTTTNGLAGNTVMAICERAAGEICVGSDGGLSLWRDGRFAKMTTADGLSHNYINALYEDRDQVLWIGTKGGGLNRYAAGRFTIFTMADGLFSDEVYEIVEDDIGYFWMSCRRGIFRVSRAQLEAFAQGSIRHLTCTAFGRDDGLATVQCNGVAKPAGWKASDGRLWFPTIRGVVAVDARIKTNELPPPVHIEVIRADRQLLWDRRAGADERAPVVVPPGTLELEIQFTGLSFQAPEKNRFRYQLDRVNPEWVVTSERRVVYTSSLRPGHYRFKVLAANNDGVWNETGDQIALQVLPFYWQTWWFRGLVGLATLAVFFAIYRIRVGRLRGLEALRVRIATDLHDDVGSRLTKVAMVTELAEREAAAAPALQPHIANISRTVREITRAMDEIVWTINPRNDTLEDLANYIFQYAQEYFQNTGVRCRLDVPSDLPHRAVTTAQRHNLFMAFKEALNNVLKHSGATEVRIGLTRAEHSLTLVIADNGRGLTAQPDPTGIGLTNMRRRLEQVGGRLHLVSKSGGGTIVTMEVPGRWST